MLKSMPLLRFRRHLPGMWPLFFTRWANCQHRSLQLQRSNSCAEESWPSKSETCRVKCWSALGLKCEKVLAFLFWLAKVLVFGSNMFKSNACGDSKCVHGWCHSTPLQVSVQSVQGTAFLQCWMEVMCLSLPRREVPTSDFSKTSIRSGVHHV